MKKTNDRSESKIRERVCQDKPTRRQFLVVATLGSAVTPVSLSSAGGSIVSLQRKRQPGKHRAAPSRQHVVMQRVFPAQHSQVTKDNYEADYARLVWALRHMCELHQTQRISRGSRPVRVLPVRPTEAIDRMRIQDIDGTKITVRAFLRKTDTDSFLVVKDGVILVEQRQLGMKADDLKHLYSLGKSLAGCMMGALFQDAQFNSKRDFSPDALLTQFLPEFSHTGYQGATLRNLLDMDSGINYMAEPDDPIALRIGERWPEKVARWVAFWRRHAQSVGFFTRPANGSVPASQYDFLLASNRTREHGATFFYKDADVRTAVLAAERHTRMRFADLFGELIWKKIGAEHDAYVVCDGSRNDAFVSAGISAHPRDLARVGLMLAERGRTPDGNVVPESYVADITGCMSMGKKYTDKGVYSPHHTDLPPELAHTANGLAYRSWWWVWPEGQFCAVGGYGQQMNVKGNVVVVKTSTYKFTQPREVQEKEALQRIGMKQITEQVAAGHF